MADNEEWVEALTDLPDGVWEAMRVYQGAGTSILDHAVEWNPAAWEPLAARGWRDLLDCARDLTCDRADQAHRISRRHVVELGDDNRDLFLASMIFGFGRVGYGPARVARMVRNEERFAVALDAIVAAAEAGSPESVWKTIKGTTTHLPGLGVAFGTKIAYFASLRADPDLPKVLIADINTSWGAWGAWSIRRSVAVLDSYVDYVKRCSSVQGVRPDLVEFGLFQYGKGLPKH